MFKRDVVNRIVARTELDRREVSLILDTCFEVIIEALAEGRSVVFHSFGSFQIRRRSAYLGANPYTGERIPIPSRAYPFFAASNGLKRLIDKKLS